MYRITLPSQCIRCLFKQMVFAKQTLYKELCTPEVTYTRRISTSNFPPVCTLGLQLERKRSEFWEDNEAPSAFLVDNFLRKELKQNNEDALSCECQDANQDERFEMLYEVGFRNVPENITRLQGAFLMSIDQLKQERLLDSYSDSLEGILNGLNCGPDIEKKIREELEDVNYSTSMTLDDLRRKILVEYICWRVGCTEDNLHFIHKKSFVFIGSFRNLREVLHIILELVKLPFSKIRTFHFHNLDAHNLKSIFNSPFLLEAEILAIVRKHPRVMSIQKDELENRIRILHSFHVTTKQILNCPKILMLEPNIIKWRFYYIVNVPELYALRQSPNFLRIVSYFRYVRQRLRNLKLSGCVDFGKINFHSRNLQHSELFAYVFRIFGKAPDEIKSKMRQHTIRQQISFSNVTAITDALMERGVSREQIWNCFYVVLYDYKLVIDCYERLKDKPELQPFEQCKHLPHLLDLIVYYIEREHDVSGDLFYGSIIEEQSIVNDAEFSVSNEDLLEDYDTSILCYQ